MSNQVLGIEEEMCQQKLVASSSALKLDALTIKVPLVFLLFALFVQGSRVEAQEFWKDRYKLRLEAIKQLIHTNPRVLDTASNNSASKLAIALSDAVDTPDDNKIPTSTSELEGCMAIGLLGNSAQANHLVISRNGTSHKSLTEITFCSLGFLWSDQLDLFENLINDNKDEEWVQSVITSAYISSYEGGFENAANFLSDRFGAFLEISEDEARRIEGYRDRNRLRKTVGANWLETL